MAICIGVDGGGTNTRVLLFDTVSGETASASGTSSNPAAVGWEQALHTLTELIDEALSQVNGTARDVYSVSACMAGIDVPLQARRVTEALKKHFEEAHIEAVSDAFAALTAGTKGAPGIVLVAGTGAVAAGESFRWHTSRSGGFGHLIGDEGSGFDVGRRGLMAAVQSREGRGPKTALWDAVQSRYGLDDAVDLMAQIYEAPQPVAEIASFAPTVVSLAAVDEVANEIVDTAILAQVRLIQSVINDLDFETTPPIVISGSLLLREGDLLERLRKRLPDYELVPLTQSPTLGALIRALRQLPQQMLGDLPSARGAFGLPVEWEEALMERNVIVS